MCINLLVRVCWGCVIDVDDVFDGYIVGVNVIDVLLFVDDYFGFCVVEYVG